MKGTDRRPVQRWPETAWADDRLVIEEPLEIRVEERSLAELMRTPGDDLELVVWGAPTGFILSFEAPTDTRAEILWDQARLLSPSGSPHALHVSDRADIVTGSTGISGGCGNRSSRYSMMTRESYRVRSLSTSVGTLW